MDKENRDVLNKWLADKTGPTPCYTDEHIELLWEEILQLRYERAEAGKRAMTAESQIQALREAAKKHLLEPSLATQQELWAALLKDGGDE
jgi:hypothetical protein